MPVSTGLIIQISAAGAQRGAAAVNKALNSVKAKSKQVVNFVKRDFVGLNSSMKPFMHTVGYLGPAIAAAFGTMKVISTIHDFEQKMSNVEAVTRAAADEMKRMERVARDLGATTKFTAVEIGGGMEFLGRAGFSALQIMKAMPSVLDLAAAGHLEMGRAADISSNIMQAFALEAEEMTRVADVLAFTAANANTDIEMLGQAMKFVAPVARALGISVEETAAMLGVLSDNGLQASMAGTGVRKVLSVLAKGGSKLNRVLASVGMTYDEINPATNDLADVMEKMAPLINDATVSMELFGDRGGPAGLAAANMTEKLNWMIDAFKDVNGYAKESARIMTDNLYGDWKRFTSAVAELMLILGYEGGFLYILRKVVQFFYFLVKVITQQVIPGWKMLSAYLNVFFHDFGSGMLLLQGIFLKTSGIIVGFASDSIKAIGSVLRYIPGMASIVSGVGGLFDDVEERINEGLKDVASGVEQRRKDREFIIKGLKEQVDFILGEDTGGSGGPLGSRDVLGEIEAAMALRGDVNFGGGAQRDRYAETISDITLEIAMLKKMQGVAHESAFALERLKVENDALREAVELGVSKDKEKVETLKELRLRAFDAQKAFEIMRKNISLQEEIDQQRRLTDSLRESQTAHTEVTLQIELENAAKKEGLILGSQDYQMRENLLRQLQEEKVAFKELQDDLRTYTSLINSSIAGALQSIKDDQEALNRLLKDGTISLQEYTNAVEILSKEQKELYQRGLAESREWTDGVERAWIRFEDAATDAAQHAEDVFQVATDGMTNTLTDFFTDGTSSFSDFAKSIQREMNRILTQRLITKPIADALTGGGEGNAFSNLLGGMMKGAVNGGIFDRPTVISEFGQKEAAVPLPDGRSIPVKLQGNQAPINIVYNISTPDASSFGESQSQIMNRTMNGMRRAQQRSGGL